MCVFFNKTDLYFSTNIVYFSMGHNSLIFLFVQCKVRVIAVTLFFFFSSSSSLIVARYHNGRVNSLPDN